MNSEELEKARLRKGSLSSDQGGVRSPGAPEVPMLERGARRYALIVANEKYMELAPLQTPRLEAEALLDVLAANGFITQIHYDLGLSDFRAAVSRFSQGLQSKDFVLFYYAGHAVEVQGNNYLLPVTFKKSDHDIVGAEGYRLDEIRSLLGRNDRNSLVIVDACRTSPFAGSTGTASSAKQIGSNSLKPGNHEGLVFSTSEQQVTFDGAGWQRSPFSRAVTYAFRQSEQGIKTAVSLARAIVIFTSQGLQVPQVSFGILFPNARISAFEHPTGFASTPVREFVHFSPERIRLEVREFAKRKGLPVQPIGVDAEASMVLTSKQKWVVRHHADQTAWETSEKEKQAINFLESRLELSGLQQADKKLWEEIKNSQRDENIVWLLEEVAFRDVGLPALFEAIPEADKMLLRDKDVRSVGIVGHAMLDFLDANNIRTLRWADENLSAIEEIPIWKPRLKIDDTKRWGNSFTLAAMTPIRARLATLGQACAAISLPEDADACQRMLESAQHDKMSSSERRLLTLLFHLASSHGMHFSQWLAASLRPGWEAKQTTFSDALSALGHSRLASAIPVAGFLNDLGDLSCGGLRKLGTLLPLDKLDGVARLVDAFCGAQLVPWVNGTKYSEGVTAGSGFFNDLTTIRNFLNTDERTRLALGAQALAAQKEERDGEEFIGTGIVEALRMPVIAKALTDCRPSSAWSTISRDTSVARTTKAWEGTAIERFVGGGWGALAMFDPGAARLQFAAEKSIDSSVPDVKIEDGNKEHMCFADILQGESTNCNSLVTTYIHHDLIKALWSALEGRWKEMDDFVDSARKNTLEYKEREKNEASTKIVSEEWMSQMNDLTIFARRLRGESVPGKLGQDWAGPLSLFSHCGMPPEIR